MSTYYKLGSLIEGLATTATAGGTTALTASSRTVQQFTGTSTQTVTLPDATTLVVGRRFDINNRSTGIVTVQDGASGALTTIAAGSQRFFIVTDVSTAAGVWRTGGVTGGGGGASVTTANKFQLLSGLAGLNASTDNIEARKITYNPEEVGGNYWLTKATLATGKEPDTFSLNGLFYSVSGATAFGYTLTAAVEAFNNDNNYFLSKTSLPVSKHEGATFILNGYGYSVSGKGASAPLSANDGYKYNDSTNAWAAISDSSTQRFGVNGKASSGYGFVFGGQTGSADYTNSIRRYNDALNSYSTASATSTVAKGYCTIFSLDDVVYVAGGTTGSIVATTYAYNPGLNVSLAKASMNTARESSGDASCGNGFAMAGYSGSYVTVCEKYSDSDFWTTIASTASSRFTSGSGSAELSGSVYIAGGYNPTFLSSVEQYVPFSFLNLGVLKSSTATPTSILAAVQTVGLTGSVPVQLRTDGDNWKSFTSNSDTVLKSGETFSKKFQASGIGYLFGGMTTTGSSSDQTTVDSYNPVANSWTTRSPLGTARNGIQHFLLGGLNYLVGGALYQTATSIVQSFSEVTGTYATMTSLPVATSTTTWQLNGDGYTVGGTGGVIAIYRYVASTNAWTQPSSLNTARSSQAGFAVRGYGYSCGGNGYTTATNVVERYNDFTNVTTTRTSMNTSRSSPAGFGLNSVGYVTGGLNTSANAISSSEFYDPDANSWTTVSGSMTARGRHASFASGGFGYNAIGENPSATASADKFNDATKTYSSIASATQAREVTGGATPGSYRNYELRIGIPAYYAGVGNFVWVTSVTSPTTAQKFTNLGSFGAGARDANSAVYNYHIRSWILLPGSGASYVATGQAFCLYGIAYFCASTDGGSLFESGVRIINPITLAITSTTSLPAAVASAASNCTLNGYGYSPSGSNGNASYTTSNYRFNPSTAAWSTQATTYASELSRGWSVGGFFYMQGGYNGSFLATNSRYNDAANSWTNRANGSSLYAGQSDAFQGGGLVVGGNISPTHSNTTACEFYLPDTDAWVSKQSKNTALGDGGGFVIEGVFHSPKGNTNMEVAIPSLKQAVLGMALEVK